MRLAELARSGGPEGLAYRSSVLSVERWTELTSEANETWLLARNSVNAFRRASDASEITAVNFLLAKALQVKIDEVSQPVSSRAPEMTRDLITIYSIFLLAASAQQNEEVIMPALARHFTRTTEIALAAGKQSQADADLTAANSLLASAIINALTHEPPVLSTVALGRMVRAALRPEGDLDEEIVRSNRTVLEWLTTTRTQSDEAAADFLKPIIASELAQLGKKNLHEGVLDRLTRNDWPSLLNTRDPTLALVTLCAATDPDKELPLKLDITVILIQVVLTRLGLTETPVFIREREVIKARQKLTSTLPPELSKQMNALVLYVQRMAQQKTPTLIAKTLIKLAHLVRFSVIAQIDVKDNVVSAAERLIATSVECEMTLSDGALEKAVVILLSALKTGHHHLSLIRFGRALFQAMGPSAISTTSFVSVATAYLDLLADTLSAGAKETSAYSESLRRARHQTVINLQDFLQAFVSACKDIATASAGTQTLADIGEGMVNETREVYARGMGALLSCFGTEIVFSMKSCRLDPLSSPINKHFLISSGMWIIEAIQYTQGGLDLSSYFSFFQSIIDRMVDKVSVMRETRLKERVVEKTSLELLFEAVSSQLQGCLVHFCNSPADLDYLSAHEDIVSRLLTSDYTLDRVPDVARALGRLLRSLATSPDRIAPSIFERVWRPVRDWAERASCQSEVSEAGRNLLNVVACSIPPECIFELASHLLMSVARSSSAETQEVFLDLTSIAVEAAAGHPDICASLEVVSKAAIEQLAKNSATQKGWYHLLSSLLVAFDTCQIPIESQTTALMQVISETRDKTPTLLWKTRLQFHAAFLSHLSLLWENNRMLDDRSRSVVMTYLLQVPFYEACWKCSSLTGVTRRRAYRTLKSSSDLILRISGPVDGSREISRILLCGMSIVECSTFQRGFVVASEKLLEMTSLKFTSQFRTVLDEVLSVSKGLCHNLEKRSTHSSSMGSRFSKGTHRSLRSIKSQYRPSRRV